MHCGKQLYDHGSQVCMPLHMACGADSHPYCTDMCAPDLTCTADVYYCMATGPETAAVGHSSAPQGLLNRLQSWELSISRLHHV